MTTKTIKQKYTAMSELNHILARSGMYIGTTAETENSEFIYDALENIITKKDVKYSPAMLKLIDEIISNSCDEYRRNDNMGLTEINISVNKEKGYIIIKDNGGIPVVKHKMANMYVPEFIFGQLRTSSNYDDSEDRNVIGTNGLGSVLTNIFSKKFCVETSDGKNKINIEWQNNMDIKSVSELKKCKDHYTKIQIYIDFSRFDTTEFTDDFIVMIEKRCIDAAAANFGLKIKFEYEGVRNSTWKFKKFEEYVELYSDETALDDVISFKDDEKQVWIYPGDSSINVGFVDGGLCSKGTHINAIRLAINKSIQDILTKKKIDVTYSNISNKYAMFCVMNVVNPSYDSQTKETLTTPANEFSRKEGYQFNVPDDFLKKCCKSEIIELVLDWYRKKQEADDVKAIRKINKEAKSKLIRSDKFINCNSKKNSEKQLWIYEGDSAASGFRGARDPQIHAAYQMRGVPLNTDDMTAVRIMQNEVFNDIVKILGLQWGEYNKVENLKFGKIVIATDMDYDGHKIAALLLLFFNHFPELFEQHLICRAESPIIICAKGTGKNKDIRNFYSIPEFNTEAKKYKGYTIKYLKGLGSLSQGPDGEYHEMMMHPHFTYFNRDKKTDEMFKKWFGHGIAETRKNMLKKDVESDQ